MAYPPHILRALGEFDLDPCSPITRPWDTAHHHYTVIEDGLKMPWFGRVWCNPPYGEAAGKFLAKCASHGNAMGLVFTRMETQWFYSAVWDKADALFFIKGRLAFHHVTGEKGGSAGCGSVLVAYGKNNVDVLRNCTLEGRFILLNHEQ